MESEFESAGRSERLIKNVRLLRYAALSILAIVVIAANVVLFRQIDLQLKRSYTAETDNTIWGFAQVEVEILRYGNALRSAVIAGYTKESLADVRLYYDLLYSRMELTTKQHRNDNLPILQSDVWEKLLGSGGILEQGLPLVDGPDEALIKGIPELLGDTVVVETAIRRQVVDTLQASINRTEADREELQSSLQLFSAVALALMGVMAGLMVVIGLQGRARERHRRELSQAVFNLRTTIDSSLEAAVILDHDGKIIGCNRAGAEMFNWQEGAYQARHFAEIIHKLRRGPEGIRQVAIACSSEAGNGRITLNGKRPDGTLFPLEVSLAQARSATGMPIAIAFMRDISELVEREKALKSARNMAQQGEQAKSRFLAMISHEMRTPLNGLLSAVELLNKSTKLDPNQAWLLRIIENCGKTTLEQVNNVLDLTSLKSIDQKNLPDVDFNVVDVINTVADQFAVEAQARGNTIIVAITGEHVQVLHGKQSLIHRILTNLVSNAVKFTEDGTITIGADFQPARVEGQVSLRLSVTDTGVGIADSDRDRIFNTFETLDSSYSRLQQGSGLGLGLAKLSAEAMGGRMTVSSRKDEGSTFALYLTLKCAAVDLHKLEPKGTAAQQPVLPPLRLLVVEDNSVNRELLVEILRQRGHEVFDAKNGVEGVNATIQQRPDAILMDISMPVMDGLEASRQIRSYGNLPSIPIIAVTANSDSVAAEEFTEAGIDAVLSKPLDLGQLENLLLQHIKKKKNSEQEASELSEGSNSRKRASKEKGSHLRLVEGEGRNTAKSVSDKQEDKNTATSSGQAKRPILDEDVFSDLNEALGKSYMQKMANRYVAEAEAAMVELKSLHSSGDFERAAAIAHKNAGAAASLGLRAMHEVLVTYEREAKAGNADAARETHGKIESIKLETFDLLRDRGLTA